MRVLFALVATLVAATLLADVRIHELYGFHVNGFVWNLVTTPGGIASLEASTETWLTVAVAIAAIFGAVLALLTWLQRRGGVGLGAIARGSVVAA